MNKELANDLAGAYVHGSLGTYEEIPYSDFDALVILKDEVFLNEKRFLNVAKKLSAARRIMLDFDPLQHHGWFVLSEKNLINYPVTYFPPELFKYSKSLLDKTGKGFNLYFNSEGVDFSIPFNNLVTELLRTLNNVQSIKNLYRFKSVLSEFMLLPALYLQARDKKGIYKKFSFNEARKDFSEEEWKIMDEISQIRQDWNYSFSPIRRLLMCRIAPLSVKTQRFFSPSLDPSLKKRIEGNFYNRMIKLCKGMNEKLNSI